MTTAWATSGDTALSTGAKIVSRDVKVAKTIFVSSVWKRTESVMIAQIMSLETTVNQVKKSKKKKD